MAAQQVQCPFAVSFGSLVWLLGCKGSFPSLHSFLPSFLPFFLPSYLIHSFLPSFLPFFLPSFLPSFLRSFLPSFLPSAEKRRKMSIKSTKNVKVGCPLSQNHAQNHCDTRCNSLSHCGHQGEKEHDGGSATLLHNSISLQAVPFR